jgi:hypothetical protein
MSTIGNLSSLGAFILAAIIALIGASQAKKKDTDRIYEYLEIMTNLKMELEFALASYSENSLSKEVFLNLDTRYTAFVNYLEYFCAKIINQKLYKNAAFKSFQGESNQALKNWAIIQLEIFRIINEVRFNVFEITSTEKTRKSHLSVFDKLDLSHFYMI